MERSKQEVKSEGPANALTIPCAANSNQPLSLKLEDHGLTYRLVGAVAELVTVLACYARTKADRRDLQIAAAACWDVSNRLRRATAGGGA